MSQDTERFRSLVERLKSGDPRYAEGSGEASEVAFKELYESLSGRVFSYIIPRVGGREEALDVLQDVFLDLWSARLRFSYVNDASVWGFIFLIARRKLAEHYGKRRRDSEISELPQEDRYDMDIDALGDVHAIELGMKELSEKDRDVLTLRYWSGLSFAEIAEANGKTESTVRVHHHRALAKLETILRNHGN